MPTEDVIARSASVESPPRLSADPSQAEQVVALTSTFPMATWGRDELAPVTCGTRTPSSPGS